MVNGKFLVEKLIAYAKSFLYLADSDEIYARNTLLSIMRLSSPATDVPDLGFIKEMSAPDVLFNEIKDYSMENGIASDDTQATLFASFAFGVLTQKPSEINATFNYLKEKMGAQAACDYLYNLSVMNNYVQKTAIEKNQKWEYRDGDNLLEITINLSKPEKDNKDIAKLVKMVDTGDKYPKCALCKENEGYLGNYNHPPRANLRTVSLTLGGEDWSVQYSPYAYFNEHCIAFNKKHVPMQMTRQTISKLFDFIEILPNYFIGSNSDLPIVGGSILNHEHYQGGRHEMPMHKAKPLYVLTSEKFPDVEISILNWYNSAVRLTGYNRNTITELGGDIVEAWKKYSDESVGVINDENDRHNSCTPVARYLSDNKFCLEIILRNNSVSETFPDGVFHAHPEYHNIKKEGIGLIEAMGLYILPGRLKKQIDQIADILIGDSTVDIAKMKSTDPLYVHKNMIKELKRDNPDLSDKDKAIEIIKRRINETCVRILDNTAVFKKDEVGVLAFRRFLNTLSIK